MRKENGAPRILGVFVHSKTDDETDLAPVDMWRTLRPLKGKADFAREPVKFDGSATDEEMEAEAKRLSHYDLIWSSYYSNPSVASFMLALGQRDKIHSVVDIDDNIYQINPRNPYTWRLKDWNKEASLFLLENAPIVTTSNERMKEMLETKINGKVFVLPNYISTEDYGLHEPNNERIRIGYWGSTSHWDDLHETGVLLAIRKLLHKYKNVELHSAGMPIGEKMPRYTYHDGKRGDGWYDLFEKLQYDIAIAPLNQEEFNKFKSNIKWQEAACMGAAFVGSNIGPYKDTVKHNEDGILVETERLGWEAWYEALEKLIQDAGTRKKLAQNARERVIRDFSIENNRDSVDKVIQSVYEYSKTL